MAIKKVGQNLWAIKVSVRVSGFPYPISKQERFVGAKTEAEIRHAEIVKGLRSGGSLTLSRDTQTFDEAINLYMENLAIRKKLSKVHEYRINRVRANFGHLQLDCVADHFEAWRRAWAMSVTVRGKRRSAADVNRYTEIVRAVFNHLVALEVVPKNPITKIRFPKLEEKPRDRYLTQEERARLLNAVREHRPHILPIVQFMMSVPCRAGELYGARREQYNMFTNTLYIPDSKAGIPIHKPVPPEMRDYFRSIPDGCPWLFYWIDEGGHYRRFQSIRRPWAFCLKVAGPSNVRVHDLRHISATDLYEAGNAERVIMDIAGWKTPMLSRYRHKDGLRSAQGIVFKGNATNTETIVGLSAVASVS